MSPDPTTAAAALTRGSRSALDHYRDMAVRERTIAGLRRADAVARDATGDWALPAITTLLDEAARADARAAQWEALAAELDAFAEATSPPAQEGLL